MARFGFIGGSYAASSPNVDAQRCINLFVEAVGSGSGKSALSLCRTPGSRVFADLGIKDPVRDNGTIAINGRVFTVAGGQVFEAKADGTKTLLGAVASDEQFVSMAASPTQVLIASGGAAYVIDLVANTLTAVDPAKLSGVVWVGYSDGFFVALLASTGPQNAQKFQVSATLDATSWDLTNITRVSVFPDNTLTLLVDHRELWIWGVTKAVVYFDSGNADFPFDVVPGAYIEQGIGAPASAVRMDNSVFWLGADDRGAGIAWRGQGYQPQRVSDHATEAEWRGYPTITDAVGFAYQMNGHTFWVLRFPSADRTWVFDAATNLWHQWQFWDAKNGVYKAHRANCHVYAFGKHLVGDATTGRLLEINDTILSDAGDGNATAPIRRIRRAPYVGNELKFMRFDELVIDIEPGIGEIPDLAGTSTDISQLILADANGVLWTLTVADNGTITTAAAPAGAVAQLLILQDSAGSGTAWQIGVSIAGVPTPAAVTFDSRYRQSLNFATSPGLLQAALQVSAGGVLSAQPPFAPSREPQAILRWSDDAAKTWSNEHPVGLGLAGQTKKRARWSRMGRARQRIYELILTDPYPWQVTDAYLIATPGYATQERIAANLRKQA